MYVNPYWFGFGMGVLFTLIAMVAIAYVTTKKR